MPGSIDTDEARLSRRSFLSALAGTGVLLVGCSADRTAPSALPTTRGAATGGAAPASPGYGPLVADPEGLLSLPEGFRYRVLAREGQTLLDSGEPAPSDPDGAAAFPRAGGAPGSVLVLNHEIGSDEPHPVPQLEGLVYDEAAHGGTTTLTVGPDGEVLGHAVSLAGTRNNCAGGRTPWGTWLSCEETEEVLGRPHGYVFEVDPHDATANRDPRPVRALGRFSHEAVAVDPDAGAVYLTEDAVDPHGSLYRWSPPADARPLGRGSLRGLAPDAGVLEALRVSTDDGQHVPDLSVATEPGTTYRVAWAPVPDREATTTSVRRQLPDDGITRARKLEGAWWGDGGAYVVSSFARADDGSEVEHDGQVWFLDPRAATLTLRLRFGVAADPDVAPDGPDNITVSPHGGLVVAEDGGGVQHLMGATDAGEVYPLARCDLTDGHLEFCGPVFSPDGRDLFANLQGPGCTFLVQGPFDSLA